MVTLLTHFYNEEYLLPWWLKQHKDMFDHAILVNYNSTDRSVEIIKEICPTWEIVNSVNLDFDAVTCDAEMMSIENRVGGYKICLNVTEFMVKNPNSDERKLNDYLSDNPTCYPILRANIVDEDPSILVTHDDDLIEVKNYGILGDIGLHPPHRFLHNHTNGNYQIGRHYTNLPVTQQEIPFMVYWYGYAPWNENLIKRKSQIKDRIPESNKAAGMGHQHLWDLSTMESFRNRMLPHAKKLR